MAQVLENVGSLFNALYNTLPALPKPKDVEKVIVKEIEMARPQLFIRLAGLSGAIAVAMGAYGAHGFKNGDADKDLKEVYDSGYRLHLIHSVALLGSSLARRPFLSGSLMLTGMVLFSGSCYYHALTGNTRIRWVTPYGGMLLIVAWISMML